LRQKIISSIQKALNPHLPADRELPKPANTAPQELGCAGKKISFKNLQTVTFVAVNKLASTNPLNGR
jgi:hypothetical protein